MSIDKLKKADFLTIPEAPNYEINGYLKVRNKTTGNILKGERRPNRNVVMVLLTTPNGKIKRSTNVLYREAIDTLSTTIWRPINSLGKKYELSPGGDVRNRKTKKLLKPINHDGETYYMLHGDGKYFNKSRRSLLNEVYLHDIPRKRPPIKVQISKDSKSYHFETIKDCARFLAERIFYTVPYIEAKLHCRPPTFLGWSLKYLGRCSK